MLFGKNRGQMANGRAAASEGALGELGKAQEGVEELAVLHDLAEKRDFKGGAFFFVQAVAHFRNKAGPFSNWQAEDS